MLSAWAIIDSDDFIDIFDLDLNQLFMRFGKPKIDINLSLEETMELFLEDLSRHKRDGMVQEWHIY